MLGQAPAAEGTSVDPGATVAAPRSHSDSDALAVALAIIALVAALSVGGLGFARRGRAVT
jgi:hypothetical protein